MKNRHIARALFNRTKYQAFFSVNDFREHNFDQVMTHPNQIGRFFGDLSQQGLAEKYGRDRAEHVEAKGRDVSRWVWTRKAHGLFSR